MSTSTVPLSVVETVWERDGGQCQRCGLMLDKDMRGAPFGWSIQHRKHRSQGGDNRLSNLILLCGSGTTMCHGWVESHPGLSKLAGWAVGGWVPNDRVHEHRVLIGGYEYELTDGGDRLFVRGPSDGEHP